MKASHTTIKAVLGTITTASLTTAYALTIYDKRDLTEDEIKKSRRLLQVLTPESTNGKSNDPYLSNLTRHGATVCKSVLSPQDLQSWNSTLYEQLEIPGACVVPIRGSKGRRHCFPPIRTSRSQSLTQPSWVAALAQLGGQTSSSTSSLPSSGPKHQILPQENFLLGQIAQHYFQHHGISKDQYGITQLQMLYAESESDHQIWHRDNAGGPSLTALIALKDISRNGPTELLLGSHLSHVAEDEAMRSKDYYHDAKEITSGVLLATLKAGDAIVYDARALHRGRGYKSGISDRPVLIIRWDAHDTPPPGTGFIGTQSAILSGIGLVSIQNLKEKLGIQNS